MYERRFPDMDCSDLSLSQIRGMEGVRVREAYRLFSKQYGVPWTKRDYKTTSWEDASPINRALSTANNVLYSICQGAIVSMGYSTGLGFIHTGKMLSFVYDIADLYKAESSIPAAFSVVGNGYSDLDGEVRKECRKRIRHQRIMQRIPEDIAWIFQTSQPVEQENALPVGDLWEMDGKRLTGGINRGGDLSP